ncbi:DUF1214 domain-containing protein [Mesorhizobium sp. Z1-4]|uniref:DUF1214 domain-containing protein n=1 Tax=Mesorhizobium sp. Z1-4 TaxID=2448478 RepID=UPI000FD7EAB9|nr:DUF1214 domain-containing protein [Mesorhizobium sp. Z1-4]
MIRLFATIAVVLITSIGGGAASVWLALNASEGIGAVIISGWTAFPDVGTPDADTYSKARFAREGGLSLGRAEGITFVASHDTTGAALKRECTYQIEGPIPSARFWTLYAADDQRVVLPPTVRRIPALHSQEMLRTEDGAISIVASRHAAPGNWLGLSGQGAMQFVLTLYDTPAATSARVFEISLPQVLKVSCDE